MSFHFMAAVTICSDLGAPKKHCMYLFIHISGRSFLHKISSLGKKTMLFILLSLITSSTKHDNCMCYTLLLLEMDLRAQEKIYLCVCLCVHKLCIHKITVKANRMGSVAQSCLTLCNHMNCSLPGSSVQGISQKEYWSGLPFPSPGDLSNPGIKLQARG